MNLQNQISFLRRTPNVLSSMVAEMTDEQFRWKPPSGNWSVLEILAHMLVEETDDFRIRVQMTLADPSQQWPDYDPEGVVMAQKFNEKDPQQVLNDFCDERAKSIAWLESLEEPDWSRTHQHRRIGPLRAGDLFLSWVSHDQLHVRQIAKRSYEMINADGSDFCSKYAGSGFRD